MAHLVTAIIKPFKLEEVKDALRGAGILGLTLITAVYDSHLLSQTRNDARRLEQVNAALQHGKNLLGLATRAAGISSWELDIATRRTLWTENEIESLRAAGVDNRLQPNAVIAMTHPEDRQIMFDAIKRSKSLSGTDIRDALAATKDFPGVTGNVTFNENRDAVKPIVMIEIKDGGTYAVKERVNVEGAATATTAAPAGPVPPPVKTGEPAAPAKSANP